MSGIRGSLEENPGSNSSSSSQATGKRRPSESSVYNNTSPTHPAANTLSQPPQKSPSSFSRMRSPTAGFPKNPPVGPTSPVFVGGLEPPRGASSYGLSPNYGHPPSILSPPGINPGMVEVKSLKIVHITENSLELHQVKSEVEDNKPVSWTEESSLRVGQPARHQRKADPQPWPDHLQRPDFFHRPTEHRPSAINHHLLGMEQRPVDIFGQQRPSPISGRLPMIEHRPYNDHRPATIGRRPPEHISSIINHRPLEARQIPDLIYRNEGDV